MQEVICFKHQFGTNMLPTDVLLRSFIALYSVFGLQKIERFLVTTVNCSAIFDEHRVNSHFVSTKKTM